MDFRERGCRLFRDHLPLEPVDGGRFNFHAAYFGLTDAQATVLTGFPVNFVAPFTNIFGLISLLSIALVWRTAPGLGIVLTAVLTLLKIMLREQSDLMKVHLLKVPVKSQAALRPSASGRPRLDAAGKPLKYIEWNCTKFEFFGNILPRATDAGGVVSVRRGKFRVTFATFRNVVSFLGLRNCTRVNNLVHQSCFLPSYVVSTQFNIDDALYVDAITLGLDPMMVQAGTRVYALNMVGTSGYVRILLPLMPANNVRADRVHRIDNVFLFEAGSAQVGGEGAHTFLTLYGEVCTVPVSYLTAEYVPYLFYNTHINVEHITFTVPVVVSNSYGVIQGTHCSY